MEWNRIIVGSSDEMLKTVPDESVDCVVTSPPYFQQRDYSSELQIGQEKNPTLFVERLCDVFAEVNRVLKDSGTLWIVIGDKYKKGVLLGTPWRLALALADQGWRLRSDIIWQKPNAMPSSVKTRPTTDHEYIFFFSKADKYFYDADAIREPHVTFSDNSKMKGGRKHFGVRKGTPEKGKNKGDSNLHDGRWDQAFHPLGRNKRTVWSISLSKNRDAHFAVFPDQLVETCIKAGCPEGGIVLDPFAGTGTTLRIAKSLGRQYLGIDCSEDYCEIARRNLDDE